MLLLANLFGTTIDEMVRGDVDEMREMVEKDEQRTRAFAMALGAVEVAVIAVLAITAVVGRAYLEPVLRLLLAVLVLASAVVALVARRGGEGREAKSAAELLGAASGDPVEAAQESASANVMRLVLQVFVGLAVGIGVLVLGDLMLDMRGFIGLAAAVGVIAALVAARMLGRYARPMWTAAILPALWVVGAIALGAATGGLASPRGWIAVSGGAISLLAFWAIGRRYRRG
ncbi:XRE family transcriptional regulator [Thermophilibacter provencensis]|uniref:XRE family transcriptional regulator n=1 Tax=Thermophilibacter provencensis TaxID=1852386 RepID=A0ABT7V0F3_9ACTN|nr:XRE family transcriptional regulator [Thermophilibacter provencensis]MDM8270093.1 XRE family transcriptional regulator [Thermophilibacter provencensis]